jgi:hypothetical protein
MWPLRRLLRRSKRVRAPQDRRHAAGDVDVEHSMLANPSDDRDERQL